MPHIQYLQVFVFLFDKQLLVELLDEVDLLVAVQRVVEALQHLHTRSDSLSEANLFGYAKLGGDLGDELVVGRRSCSRKHPP